MPVTPFTMTSDEFRAYDNDQIGLCIECGAERENTEPDAREYDCPECEANAVFGVPELLMSDDVEIVEEGES